MLNCMKCGRELQDQKVFCPDCLEDMEKYPVKPDTLILLPTQQAASAGKKKPAKAKRPLKPEEQLARARNSMRLLTLALCAALLAFALTAFLLLRTLDGQDAPSPESTGNYTENTDVSHETTLPR